MQIATKELRALAWVAEKDGLGSVDVEHHVDGSDVGWLLATIDRDRSNQVNHHRVERYFVSPLGHVYEDESLEPRTGEPQRGDLVREGPGPG